MSGNLDLRSRVSGVRCGYTIESRFGPRGLDLDLRPSYYLGTYFVLSLSLAGSLMACNSLSNNWPKGVRGCRGSFNDWNMDFFFTTEVNRRV